jgi:hypothetical protein
VPPTEVEGHDLAAGGEVRNDAIVHGSTAHTRRSRARRACPTRAMNITHHVVLLRRASTLPGSQACRHRPGQGAAPVRTGAHAGGGGARCGAARRHGGRHHLRTAGSGVPPELRRRTPRRLRGARQPGFVSSGSSLLMAHGDRDRRREALRTLDLHVHLDPLMSPTAEKPTSLYR